MKKMKLTTSEQEIINMGRFPFYHKKPNSDEFCNTSLIVDLKDGEAWFDTKWEGCGRSIKEYEGQHLAITIDPFIRSIDVMDAVESIRDEVNFILALVDDVKFDSDGKPDRAWPKDAEKAMHNIEFVHSGNNIIESYKDLDGIGDDLNDVTLVEFDGYVSFFAELEDTTLTEDISIKDLILDELESRLEYDLDEDDEVDQKVIAEFVKILESHR